MFERRRNLFRTHDWRAIPRWFDSKKTYLLLLILLASALVLPAWGGNRGHRGWGRGQTWPPGGNIPYMEILQVERDTSVQIAAHRFPIGAELELTMGLMWTRGVNGIVVETVTVVEDPFVQTFNIPAELAGEERISIRLESDHRRPYYAFNWFFNSSTASDAPMSDTTIPGTPTPMPTLPVTATPLPAAPAPTNPNPMSFAAIADTYVHQENPADNYGAADALRSDRLPAIGSFLRFDVQSLPGAVVSATLRIYANSSSGIGYEFHEVTDDAWDEFTMTYENAPDIGRLVGVSGPFTGDSWTEVDVTDLITAEGILSLALTSQDVTAGSYSSREGSHPPELLIMTAD